MSVFCGYCGCPVDARGQAVVEPDVSMFVDLRAQLATEKARAERGEADAAALREALEHEVSCRQCSEDPGGHEECSDCTYLEARRSTAGAALLAERDVLRARVERLEAALRGAERWMWDPDEPGQFDRIAEEFHRTTGVMRPGKDQPPGVWLSDEERRKVWDGWRLKRNREVLAAARAALAKRRAKR